MCDDPLPYPHNYIVFDGTPRTRIDITATVGALDGEASSKGNSHVTFITSRLFKPSAHAQIESYWQSERSERSHSQVIYFCTYRWCAKEEVCSSLLGKLAPPAVIHSFCL